MTTKKEEIEQYIAILDANLTKSFNPVRIPGQRSTATALSRERFVKSERRTSFKTKNPPPKTLSSASFEGGARFNSESANGFVKMLNANPNLVANAARELQKNGSGLYAICSRVTHPAVIKQMFLNPELLEQIALEGKKIALLQKFVRIRNARVIL